MAVALEHLHARPALVPVPQLDEHVVAAREQARQHRVRGDRADVVGVRLKGAHLLFAVRAGVCRVCVGCGWVLVVWSGVGRVCVGSRAGRGGAG